MGELFKMATGHIMLLYTIGILLLFCGSIFSLILYSNPVLSNRISNLLSTAACSILSITSFYKILFLKDINLDLGFESNIPFFALNFKLDNLAAFFVLVISLTGVIVSIYSFDYMSHYFYRRNIAILGLLYNLFILSMILLVLSNNLLLFLVFWELMSLISYFLVIFDHDKEETQKAGRIYIIMTHIGTAFIIAAFSLIAYYGGSFNISEITSNAIPSKAASLIFVFLLIGFGTKAGLIPMHIWLPEAHPVAPSNISALMSGVMIKMAVYGILRIVFDILQQNSLWWGVITLIIGFISAILGIAYAVVSTVNIKRLLAYSSIENMGIIFSAIGLALIAKSNNNLFLLSLSFTVVLLHTLNHSVFKSLLFMGAGAIHSATHTKNIEKLGGLIKKMPYCALFIFIGCLAISAVPPFNGFLSEYMIFQTLINGIIYFTALGKLWMVIILIIAAATLALTGALVAYCFVKLFGIAFLGLPRTASAENAAKPGKSIAAALGGSAVLCMILGISPKYVIGFIDNVSMEFIGKGLLSTDWSLKSFINYPASGSSLSISVISLTLLVLILALAVAGIVILIRKKTAITRYGTWDCGFESLTPKMQYTGTGFAKPVRIILRGIFRPSRELVISEGAEPYFIKKGHYKVATEKIFEKYFYAPIVKSVINFSRKMRFSIQTGSIHTYLMYFFIAIIMMLLYYAFLSA